MELHSSRLLTLSFLILFASFVVVTEGNHEHTTFVKRIVNHGNSHLPTAAEEYGAEKVDPGTTTNQRTKKQKKTLYDDNRDLVAFLQQVHGPAQLVQMTSIGRDKHFLEKFLSGNEYELDYTQNCKDFAGANFLPEDVSNWMQRVRLSKDFFGKHYERNMMPLCSLSTLPELRPEETGLFVMVASVVIWTDKWNHPKIIKPKAGAKGRKIADLNQITWLNSYIGNIAEIFRKPEVAGKTVRMKKIGKVVYNRADLMATAEMILKGHKPGTSTS